MYRKNSIEEIDMIKLSKETHLEMFTKMERIREFDSRINKLVRRGFVQGMSLF